MKCGLVITFSVLYDLVLMFFVWLLVRMAKRIVYDENVLGIFYRMRLGYTKCAAATVRHSASKRSCHNYEQNKN